MQSYFGPHRLRTCLATAIVVLACGGQYGGAADLVPTDAGLDLSLGDSSPHDALADSPHEGVLAPSACTDLIPEACLFPFPSMAHLRADPQSPTGWRVHLQADAIPYPEKVVGHRARFLARFNAADGFSIATPLLALFPSARVDERTLPHVTDLAASITPQSSVQVLDRESGERVPVWAEMDNRAILADGSLDHARRTMIIRPQAALRWGHRYAVVITDGVKDESGNPLPRPAAMQALIDQKPTGSVRLEAQRADFEALLAFLASHEVPRGRVVLAWEFVTMSRDFAEAPLRSVLEAARKAASKTFQYRYQCHAANPDDRARLACAKEPGLHPTVWRRLEGTFEVPSFLDSEGFIQWSDDSPVVQGVEQAQFVAMLPASVAARGAGTVPIVQVGHGLVSHVAHYLMVSKDSNGTMQTIDTIGAFAIGTQLRGLSTADLADLLNVIADFDTMFLVHDRLLQGLANQSLVVSFVNSTLAHDPALEAAGGGSLIGPSHAGYFGISLGGMAGAAFMATSPEVKTGVFHVGSAMFSALLQHSSEFLPFQQVLDALYADPVTQQTMLAFLQRGLDPIDPINWRERLLDEPLTPLGRKNVLWQVSYNDTNAPDFGVYALLRSTSVPLVTPSTHEVFGVTATLAAPSPPGSSGMVIFDAGKEAPTYSNFGVKDNGAHHALRCLPEVWAQVADFLAPGREGTIILHCGGGPCFVQGKDCRTGL